MKLQVSVLTCGRCGKPRGRYHACPGRRGGRDRVGLRLRFTCRRCGREMKNPLSHTCAPKSDFKKRLAAEKRRKLAEDRKRKRQAAAARKRERDRKRKAEAAARRKAAAAKRRAEAKARPRRKRTAAHVPRLCRDVECQRYGCLKYREGYDDGYKDGYDTGYGDGRKDGFAEALKFVGAG